MDSESKATSQFLKSCLKERFMFASGNTNRIQRKRKSTYVVDAPDLSRVNSRSPAYTMPTSGDLCAENTFNYTLLAVYSENFISPFHHMEFALNNLLPFEVQECYQVPY
jgi:hypothetical protein